MRIVVEQVVTWLVAAFLGCAFYLGAWDIGSMFVSFLR